MPFSFANPLGFWALLGIPAIILIHFLQQRSKVLKISTLFLLDHLQHDSVKGNRFDQLRPSIPLWLQLLAVLVLTWILTQPRWIQKNSVQRIAIVLDSSASMSAFKENIQSELQSTLQRLSSKVHRSEYVVIDSHRSQQPIFNGTDRRLALQAIQTWQPLASSHDFTPALGVARSIVGREGLLIMLSDHLIENLPHNAHLLAVGQKTPNVGFAGMRIISSDDGEILWKALVRNYSDQSQTRTWFLHSKDKKSSSRSLQLEAGQTRSLQGAFPAGIEKITLQLESDDFSLDDQLPIVLPKKKQLSLATQLPPKSLALLQNLLKTIEQVSLPQENTSADVSINSYDPLQPAALPSGNSIIFLKPNTIATSYLKGSIYSEHHALMEGLNWQSLLAKSGTGLPLRGNDIPLLWQDQRTLIFLRSSGNQQKLIFNFDLASSNVTRLPAFIVTIHRFIESIREQKVAPSQANFETAQSLHLAYDHDEKSSPPALITSSQQKNSKQALFLSQKNLFHAPRQACFFEIQQGDGILLSGATHFADTREADLLDAASRNDLAALPVSLIEQHSQQDDRWQLWLLLLCLCLLLSWHFITRTSTHTHPATHPPST
ncbi:MAG: BatA domain-containing protein [Verrucomicrobiales bacterium]|nr:BatA domain-containing protein [Verrucomicrobiales bacterium]